MFLRGMNSIMAALPLYKYEIKSGQHQQQTSVPYSEGTMLYSFKILMPLNQIRSNTTSNQTLATRCCGSVCTTVRRNKLWWTVINWVSTPGARPVLLQRTVHYNEWALTKLAIWNGNL